jgi:hypothetical protein
MREAETEHGEPHDPNVRILERKKAKPPIPPYSAYARYGRAQRRDRVRARDAEQRIEFVFIADQSRAAARLATLPNFFSAASIVPVPAAP